ncbi:MAG: hypothetical protein ABL869_01695 [Candidatus Nitrotoga sp.]
MQIDTAATRHTLTQPHSNQSTALFQENSMRKGFVSFLLIGFLGLAPSVAFPQAAADLKKPNISNINGRKVTRFNVSGEFVWCGAENIAISGGYGGVRLLNIDSGKILQLAAEKSYRGVACTPDGKQVFFLDNASTGKLGVIDVVSGKQDTIYSKNIFSHLPIGERPISPSGTHLLVPSKLNVPVQVSGKKLEFVPVPRILGDEEIDDVAWIGSQELYLLFGRSNPQRLLATSNQTKKNIEIKLPIVKGYQFRKIAWADEKRQLYLLAWPESEESVPRLYIFYPDLPTKPIRLIASNVVDFDLLPNGIAAYVQTEGVNFSIPDKAIINKSARRILVYRGSDGKKEELISVPYLSEGISHVHFSPLHNAIAFSWRDINGGSGSTSSVAILHITR